MLLLLLVNQNFSRSECLLPGESDSHPVVGTGHVRHGAVEHTAKTAGHRVAGSLPRPRGLG